METPKKLPRISFRKSDLILVAAILFMGECLRRLSEKNMDLALDNWSLRNQKMLREMIDEAAALGVVKKPEVPA